MHQGKIHNFNGRNIQGLSRKNNYITIHGGYIYSFYDEDMEETGYFRIYRLLESDILECELVYEKPMERCNGTIVIQRFASLGVYDNPCYKIAIK